ncbi:hypothetical protein CIT25_12200 [Mesorhizobium mediterraneum]|uniref:Propionyl-coenzyme A carboxylase alpha polypeptide n=1 Tax=Mesorhizobium mediterraneum TaxID=43617 RepID=A0AB36RB84_9HYPH|nr:hypothetical protein CIT25_12200 [Mesorhizobium mediterraneum]
MRAAGEAVAGLGLWVGALRRPPLACRTSPPQGGRSAASLTAPFFQRLRLAKPIATSNLPLVGEMAGRPEGGAVLEPFASGPHLQPWNPIPRLANGLARSIFFQTANGWKRG